jgi:hypothetical protein
MKTGSSLLDGKTRAIAARTTTSGLTTIGATSRNVSCVEKSLNHQDDHQKGGGDAEARQRWRQRWMDRVLALVHQATDNPRLMLHEHQEEKRAQDDE